MPASLDYVDSFDSYETAQMLEGRWTSKTGTPVITTDTPRTGLQCLELDGTGQELNRVRSVAVTEWLFGQAFYLPTGPNGSPALIEIRNAANTRIAGVSWTGGNWAAFKDNGGVAVYNSGIAVATAAYQHLELYVKQTGAATGIIRLRINNVLVVDQTGLDLGTDSDRYRYADGGASRVIRIDDHFCIVGGETYLGAVKAGLMVPVANATPQEFTPSAGSAYECVDEVPPNDDTDYISSGAVGNKSAFQFTLPVGTTTILGLAVTHRSKAVGGSDHFQNYVNDDSESNEAVGADEALSADYAFYQDGYLVDPVTSGALTPALVEARRFGVKHNA